MSSHLCRALPPAQAPPPFDPPVLLAAKRVTGTVIRAPPPEIESSAAVSDNNKSSNINNDPLDGEKAFDAESHILVVEHGTQKKAFLLQRKVGTLVHGSIRVGHVLKTPDATDEGLWELAQSSSPGNSSSNADQREIVAVIVEEKSKILPDDSSGHGNTSIDPAAELSALQLVATHDPEGVGHVMGTMLIATDQRYVYAITDYHREGSLFEYCAEVGRLGEREARFFFRQILKVKCSS
jgi:hypothetical protein